MPLTGGKKNLQVWKSKENGCSGHSHSNFPADRAYHLSSKSIQQYNLDD
jgi:hypothetical protein